MPPGHLSDEEDIDPDDRVHAPSVYNVFYGPGEELPLEEVFAVKSKHPQENPQPCKCIEVEGVHREAAAGCSAGNAPPSRGVMPTPRNAAHSSQPESRKCSSKKEREGSGRDSLSLHAVPTQTGMDTSVMQAWKECSTAPLLTDLSSMFLSDVDPSHKADGDATEEPSSIPDAQPDTSHSSSKQPLTLGASIWIPVSSVPVDDPGHIDFSDLPPPGADVLPRKSSNLEWETESSTLSCKEEDWEDEADNMAIEELEWELASTIDGGRETRAELEEEEEGDVIWSHMSMEQLMEDFEQYQDKLKEQEDTA